MSLTQYPDWSVRPWSSLKKLLIWEMKGSLSTLNRKKEEQEWAEREQIVSSCLCIAFALLLQTHGQWWVICPENMSLTVFPLTFQQHIFWCKHTFLIHAVSVLCFWSFASFTLHPCHFLLRSVQLSSIELNFELNHRMLMAGLCLWVFWSEPPLKMIHSVFLTVLVFRQSPTLILRHELSKTAMQQLSPVTFVGSMFGLERPTLHSLRDHLIPQSLWNLASKSFKQEWCLISGKSQYFLLFLFE